jgi:hypothetical protein
MISAGTILRNIALRQRQSEVAQIIDLPDNERAAAVDALSRVKADAKVDVAVLIATLRKEAQDRASAAAARAPDLLGVFNFGLSLMTQGELERMRDDLRARVDAGSGDQPLLPSTPGAMITDRHRLAIPSAPVEQPDELDDDELDDEPRAAVRRVRSRRHRQQASPAASARKPFFIGPRLLGVGDPDRPYGMSIDYNRHAAHFDPPWLLPDEETHDVAIETRADAY